jgi:hypothetical protein
MQGRKERSREGIRKKKRKVENKETRRNEDSFYYEQTEKQCERLEKRWKKRKMK